MEEAPVDEEAPGCTVDEEAPGCIVDEETPGCIVDEETPGCIVDEETPGCIVDEETPGCIVDEEAPGCIVDEEAPTDEEAPGNLVVKEAPCILIDKEAPGDAPVVEEPASTKSENPRDFAAMLSTLSLQLLETCMGTVSELGPGSSALQCVSQCGVPQHTAVQLLEACRARRSDTERHCPASARPVYDWVPNLKTLQPGALKWARRYLFAIGCNHDEGCQCRLTEGAYCICGSAHVGGVMRGDEIDLSGVDPDRVAGWQFASRSLYGWRPLALSPYIQPHPDTPGIVLPVPKFRQFETSVCDEVVKALDTADAALTRLSLLFPHIAQLRSVMPEMLDGLLTEMLDRYARQLQQHNSARTVACAAACAADCQLPSCAERAAATAASHEYVAAITWLCSAYCQKFDTTPSIFKKALEAAVSKHRLQRLRKRSPGVDLTVDEAAHRELVRTSAVAFECILPNIAALHQRHVCAVVCGASCQDNCVDQWGHPIVSANAVNLERINRVMAVFAVPPRTPVPVGADVLHRAQHHGECRSVCVASAERALNSYAAEITKVRSEFSQQFGSEADFDLAAAAAVDCLAHEALMAKCAAASPPVDAARVKTRIAQLHRHVCELACGHHCRGYCRDTHGATLVDVDAVKRAAHRKICLQFGAETGAACESACTAAVAHERVKLDKEMAAHQHIPKMYQRYLLDPISLLLVPATRNCPAQSATENIRTEALRSVLNGPLFADPTREGSFAHSLQWDGLCGKLSAPTLNLPDGADGHTELHRALIEELRAAITAASTIAIAGDPLPADRQLEFAELLTEIGDLKEVIEYYEAVIASHRRQIQAFHQTLATTASKRATEQMLQDLFDAAVEKATAMDPKSPMLEAFKAKLAETFDMVRTVNDWTADLSVDRIYLEAAKSGPP